MVSPASPGPEQSPGDPAPPTPDSSPVVQLIDRVATGFWSWGWIFLLVAIAPGIAIWPLVHPEDTAYIATGILDTELRHEILLYGAVSFGVVSFLYVAAYAWARRRIPDAPFGATCRRVNRYTFVGIAAPVMAALVYQGLERSHPFLTLGLIGIVSVMFTIFFYRLVSLRPDGPASTEQIRFRFLPPLVVLGLGIFYATYVSSLALLDHRNLGTHVFDLGIYDNIFWHNANGVFMGCAYCKGGTHMSSHFDPILWMLSPIYRLAPDAKTILVLQSVWLSVGVIPLYLLGKRRLGNPWLGVLLSAVYVLYPALHGVNMFDFHSLTLVIPSLLFAIYLIDAGAVWRYWPVFALMMATREDIPLLACFLGAYAILSRRPGTGLATIIIALSYLTVVKLYVMNDPGLLMEASKESTSFRHFYSEMIPHSDEGLKGLVVTLVSAPVFAMQVLFKEGKLLYFLQLLLPLLFLPLLSGRKTIMMIYGFVFIGLASRSHIYSLHFQYSSVLFPIFLASVPDAIDRVSRSKLSLSLGLRQRRVVWSLMWGVLFCTLLTSYKFGVFWKNDAFKAGWNRLARPRTEEHRRRYKYLHKVVDKWVPDDASVCASSSLGPQVSNRAETSKWPKYQGADFLLISTKKKKKKTERRLERLVRSGRFRLLGGKYDVELYQAVPKEEQAEARKQAREAGNAKRKPVGAGSGGGKRASEREDGGFNPNEDEEFIDDQFDGSDSLETAAGRGRPPKPGSAKRRKGKKTPTIGLPDGGDLPSDLEDGEDDEEEDDDGDPRRAVPQPRGRQLPQQPDDEDPRRRPGEEEADEDEPPAEQ